jgi:hypothetical protein
VDLATRLGVQAVAGGVFIAALAWGGVRAALITLLTVRYMTIREQQRPESKQWSSPGFLGWDALLISSAFAWPAAFVFAFVRASGRLPQVTAWPGVALWAAAIAWPVVAVVILVLRSRSPWAPLRAAISRAARTPESRRHEALEAALEDDPQIAGAVPAEG